MNRIYESCIRQGKGLPSFAGTDESQVEDRCFEACFEDRCFEACFGVAA